MINELTSEILFRCPCCQKLYQTDKSEISTVAQDQKIEFECLGCESDFYLKNQITSTGFYASEKKSHNDFVKCPKCQSLKSKDQDECQTCGVFQSKFIELSQLESPMLYELNNLWNKVILDFENDVFHQTFLDRAQKMSALNFAAQKYFDMQKLIGNNISCEKYLKQIEMRLSVQASQINKSEKLNSVQYNFDFKKYFIEWASNPKNILLFVSFIAFLFFIVNILRPIWPSINGLVLAFVALSIGLWSLSKNQKKYF